ncbi:uncharacterized protein LOC121736825 isoform X2 [Aricia agestis]|uniref:uncharacterized protein LOC121736825 isoform X2 n=1 Tax=Aricia agestis TaxID=91739 RepID=UPI001C20664C|nr:uncharacterized protein LOC121736825 isoform X2 [Aricia agestis]
MAVLFLVLFVSTEILNINCIQDARDDVTKRENFVFWPDGVVPFFIQTRNFDKDQQLAITSALAKFSFKTCLQFKPVFEEPKLDRHVLVLENPHGIKKCVINTKGHAVEEPHRLTIGFDCLASPRIDMMIMRALGFPFEHNRASRDIYIDVLLENVDQGAIELYAKEQKLPIELRALPYDVNSVMHFDDREYSKNGHRTFIFKNPNTRQNRVGLSPTDLQKVNIIYGPECKTRDRLAKLKICSNYPENKRRKREADSENKTALELDNKNDSIDGNKNETHIEVEKNVTNLLLPSNNLNIPSNKHVQGTKDGSSEDVNIARTSDTDKLLVELVRKIKQVRKLSIALAKRHKTKSGSARTKDTDEDMALTVVNLLYTLSENTTSTDEETSSGLKVARSGGCDKCNGEYCSTKIRPCCTKDKSDDCESKESYATTKNRPEKVYTQLRNVLFSTRYYSKYRRYVDNEDISSFRHKREANATDNVVSGEVTTIPHNVTKIENTTLKTDKDSRRTYFFNRDIFDTENGFIKVDNYAAITLPQFGGFSREVVKKERKDVEMKIIRNKDITEDEVMPGKKSITELYAVDNIHLTSVQTPYEFGTTRKVEKSILPQTVQLSQGNKDFYGERIWPEGIVYFSIENNPKYDINNVRQKLEEVNKILQTYTCVELQEIKEDKKTSDYIVLDTSADFVVGRVGGKQKFGVLELFEGGQHRQHAAMVVMGMLGFYFELARHDRDKYVLVHMRHIRPDKLHHFEKLHADATLAVPYDYRSATHPPWQYWRRLGKSGISSVATHKDKDPDGTIMKSLGQNSRLLSKLDLVKINSVYGTACFENASDK